MNNLIVIPLKYNQKNKSGSFNIVEAEIDHPHSVQIFISKCV